MKYIYSSVLIAFIFYLISFSTTAYSRGMQIFDGEPTAPQCRACHYDLERFPMLGLYAGFKNPDRHHLLIGNIIPPLSRSKAPDAIGAKNEGQPYNCFSCHKFTINKKTGEQDITEPFRNCLLCHPAWIVTGGMGGMGGRRGGMGGGGSNGSEINNVHMDRNPLFLQRQCRVCHNRGMGRR